MAIEYLYYPEIVAGILNERPSLARNLGDPAKEGQEALSFSELRKTRREIYRVLSNQHYPHLADLINSLEHCLKNGWEQPALLSRLTIASDRMSPS